MRILNFGSMNLDYVYTVQDIARAGETVKASARHICCGGKGLNQSIALSRAGAPVWHAGLIGNDGAALRDILKENGADVSLVREVEGPSSHTVIQVDSRGQNSILFYAGGELRVTEDYIQEVLGHFDAGDYLLLQNELDSTARIIRAAKARGMRIVLNPSPINEELKSYPLDLVDCFLLNEIEGGELTGESEPYAILDQLHKRYSYAMIVLTLGDAGALCFADGTVYDQGAYPARVVNTTAAGDTFTGYFLASLVRGEAVPDALRRAARASAVTVSRPGAADSIPRRSELEGA